MWISISKSNWSSTEYLIGSCQTSICGDRKCFDFQFLTTPLRSMVTSSPSGYMEIISSLWLHKVLTRAARCACECGDENVEPRLETRSGVTFAAVCLLGALLLQIPGECLMCRSKSPLLPLSAGEKLFFFFFFYDDTCFCVHACLHVRKHVKRFTADFYRCASPPPPLHPPTCSPSGVK